jgi:hypothetical protein
MTAATKPAVAARPRQLTYEERTARFPLDFTVDDEGTVLVPQSWRAANLRQLIIPLQRRDAKVAMVHKHAIAVFDAWLEHMSYRGADRDILTFDGAFVPRLKRGVEQPKDRASKAAWGKLLSNHSRGCAIDINAAYNRMGTPGAAPGEKGDMSRIVECHRMVRVQVETPVGHVWDAGLVWGGDWKGKSIDKMHAEVGTWEP